MTAPEPTQPLTDAELARIESHWSRYREFPDRDNAERVAEDVPDLLAEADRLRAENTAMAAQVAVARAELQRCMGRLEPYARQLKAAGNTDAGVPVGIAVGVLRLAQERIDEAEPAALDQSGEGQANG